MKRATFQELPSVEGHSELAVIAWGGGSGSISHLKHMLPLFFFFLISCQCLSLAKLNQKLEDREPKDAVHYWSALGAQSRGKKGHNKHSKRVIVIITSTQSGRQLFTFHLKIFLLSPATQSRGNWLKMNQREKQRVGKASEKSVTSDIHFLPSSWFNFTMLISLLLFFAKVIWSRL